MVLTSSMLLGNKPAKVIKSGPHRFWKRRRILSLAGHFAYRKQRCYSMAIRAVRRSWMHSRNSHIGRKAIIAGTWDRRLEAACNELKTNSRSMVKVLSEIGIGVDRKTLQNLAIWEPRTFRGLAMLTKAKSETQGLNTLDPPPKGVITRGMI